MKVAAGLNALLKLSWRQHATKIVVFIADAPPHGIEESGDDYPNGDPSNFSFSFSLSSLVLLVSRIYHFEQMESTHCKSCES